MANRKTHVAVGTACGGALAYYRSEGQLPADRLCEVIGGLLGGYAGARLADVIDIPTSPCHRDHAHSFMAGLGIAAKTKEVLLSWESDLRRRLQDVRTRRVSAATDSDKMYFGLLELLLQIGVGILSGLIAGHLSHLALDFRTPGGLPLV